MCESFGFNNRIMDGIGTIKGDDGDGPNLDQSCLGAKRCKGYATYSQNKRDCSLTINHLHAKSCFTWCAKNRTSSKGIDNQQPRFGHHEKVRQYQANG